MLRFGLLMMYLFVGVDQTYAKIIYVQQTSDRSHADRSWKNAYAEINQAFLDAQPGDQIWVAEGRYRESPLIGKPGIQMYGGFTGFERSLKERDSQNHPTVLDGESFQTITGPFMLDGFSITGRKVSAIQTYASKIQFRNCQFFDNDGNQAGAVNCFPNSTVAFTDCSFQNNNSNSASAVMVNQATAQFVRCKFRDNGFHPTGDHTSFTTVGGLKSSSLLFQECQFVNNRGFHSGSILLEDHSILQSESSEFSFNQSDHAGGAILMMNGILRLNRCYFTFNSSQESGGAVAVIQSNAHIASSTFSWNKTIRDYTNGGAIFLSGGNGLVEDSWIGHNSSYLAGGLAVLNQDQSIVRRSTILENVSSSAAGGIGCLYSKQIVMENALIENNLSLKHGGGIYFEDIESAGIFGCMIRNNHVIGKNFPGGGFYGKNTHAVIEGCFFIQNTSHPWNTMGGAICANASSLDIFFSLFNQNSSALGSDIGISGTSALNVKNSTFIDPQARTGNSILLANILQSPTSIPSIPPDIDDSIIWGYQSAILPDKDIQGENLIQSADKDETNNRLELNSLGFIDPMHGDFHLKPSSPLIDAGNNETYGNQHPYDGDGDGHAVWDLGAFEYRGPHQAN